MSHRRNQAHGRKASQKALETSASRGLEEYKSEWMEYNRAFPCEHRVLHAVSGHPAFFTVECLLEPYPWDESYDLQMINCKECSRSKPRGVSSS